jgi:hypothetical protein
LAVCHHLINTIKNFRPSLYSTCPIFICLARNNFYRNCCKNFVINFLPVTNSVFPSRPFGHDLFNKIFCLISSLIMPFTSLDKNISIYICSRFKFLFFVTVSFFCHLRGPPLRHTLKKNKSREKLLQSNKGFLKKYRNFYCVSSTQNYISPKRSSFRFLQLIIQRHNWLNAK